MPTIYRATNEQVTIADAKRSIIEALPRERAVDVWVPVNDKGEACGDPMARLEESASIYASFIDADFASHCEKLSIQPRMMYRPVLRDYTGQGQDLFYVLHHDEFAKLAAEFGINVVVGAPPAGAELAPAVVALAPASAPTANEPPVDRDDRRYREFKTAGGDYSEDTAAQTGPRYSVGMGALYQAESEGMPPRPEFREQARPRCVDPELLALEPKREVLFHELPGLMTGCGAGRAFEVVARVEEQIARQASGFFTLAEAAHILANANAGCDVRDLIQRMMAAIVGRTAETPKGRRLPRELGSKNPALEGADSLAFLWVASPEDIDEWLAGSEMRVPYRFPKATEAEPAAGSQPRAEQAPDEAPPLEDYSALATRAKLIAAFGTFTGMDMAWFASLKDTPALLKARKVPGVGARGKTREPLFCPWEVMLWLADPERKKGRPFHNTGKPWQLLEAHFPAAYVKHSMGDPREERTG